MACVFGEEVRRVQTEGASYEQQAFWRGVARGGGLRERAHGVEERQRDGDSGRAKEGATGDGGSGHGRRRLLVFEGAALDNFVNQRLKAAPRFRGAGDHLFDEFAVSELRFYTGGVGKQFLEDVSGDLVGVGEEDPFVFINIRKRLAIGGYAADFDVGTSVNGTAGVGGNVDGAGLGFDGRAVELAEAADGVERLEGEARGIDVLVTRVARREGAMFVELLADGGRAADVGFDRGNIRWRGRRGFADQMFEYPLAAKYG